MQDYVLWFDVSVDDSEGVDFVDCVADLFHEEGDLGLGLGLGLLEVVVQLAACAYLEDDVDVLVIVEVTVHFDNVRVV